MPVKKAKRKLQHQQAIAAYKQWEKKNPKASRERKEQEFNILVDTSLLTEVEDDIQTTAA